MKSLHLINKVDVELVFCITISAIFKFLDQILIGIISDNGSSGVLNKNKTPEVSY